MKNAIAIMALLGVSAHEAANERANLMRKQESIYSELGRIEHQVQILDAQDYATSLSVAS